MAMEQSISTNRKKGFTLMEVMIAITVLFVGAVGLVSLLNYSIVGVRASVNKLIAANLAQEGIEVVRHDRDKKNNWTNQWYKVRTPGDYRASIRTQTPYNWVTDLMTSYAPESDYRLYYDDVSGLYNHSGDGQLSIFYRKIVNTRISLSLRRITSIVWWRERGNKIELVIENRMYDWKE